MAGARRSFAWFLAACALLAACDGAAVLRAAPRPLVRSRASAAGLRPTTMSSLFGSESIELKPGSKTMIVGVQIKQQKYKTLMETWSLTDSLDELVRLCETAGLVVTARESQVMQHPSPSTFIGTGKLDEIVATATAGDVTVVVFDDELSPAQARNLQAAFMVGTTTQAIVLDRTQLILQIFAQRARTRVAKLQVQAAQMKYMMPRLTSFLTAGAGMDAKGGSGSGGGSGGGGGGSALRGTGETQLESDKRLFRKQIQKIEQDMEEVRLQRERYRAKRVERDNLPVIAIVGYTNAGKSTLLNTLCDAEEVYADDLLFATLDPTTRLVRLPQGREVLLSDTVGFIQKLPTRLVASFRATLDELEDASIVLHVVDASSPFASQQIWSVQQIITELGQQKTPQILVLNKADKAGVGADGAALDALGADADGALAPDAPAALAPVLAGAEFGRLPRGAPMEAKWLRVHPELTPACAVIVSAKTGAGLVELLETVESALRTLSVPVEALVPYAAGDVLAEIHRDGTIALEEFRESGTYVRAHVPRSLFNKLSKYVVSSAPRT